MSLTIPKSIGYSAGPDSKKTVELHLISAGGWTDDDVDYVEKFIQAGGRRGLNRNWVFEQAVNGVLKIYRITGKAKGIWIVQLGQHPNGMEFCCWGMAGDGVWRVWKQLWELHKLAGANLGCRWVTAYTEDRRIKKMLVRVGLQQFMSGHMCEVRGALH